MYITLKIRSVESAYLGFNLTVSSGDFLSNDHLTLKKKKKKQLKNTTLLFFKNKQMHYNDVDEKEVTMT